MIRPWPPAAELGGAYRRAGPPDASAASGAQRAILADVIQRYFRDFEALNPWAEEMRIRNLTGC